jgi:hypothetical protein
VPSVANERFDPVLMARLTNRDVLTLRGFPSQDVMRIVARRASQLTGRLLKAGGLAQSIALMSDLEFVIVSRPGSVVKKQLVVGQQLSGTIRKHASVESSQRIWQLRAGGLKVTLQANVHLALSVELARIYYGIADLRKIAARLDRFDMIATRAVASLAVNAFRDAPRKTRFAADPVGPRCDFRIPGVAEHALVQDLATEAGVVGSVVAWIHRPIAALFRVPGQRQLEDPAFWRPMQIRSRMVARPHHQINLFFDHVCFTTVETDLVAPLVILAAFFVDCEVLV